MEFNADLVEDLAKKRVVLFLGAGVSASSKTRSGKPIRQWEAFLRDTADFIGSADLKKLIVERIESKDFLIAAELLKGELKHRWSDALRDEFGQVGEASSLHKAIIELRQRIIITTNFDKLLEGAWSSLNMDTHYPQVLTKIDNNIFKIFRDNHSYIIKLHGTIDDETSMVFTKSEYSEKAFGSWIYDELLRVLLLTHTFLFIGFSMNDPAISLIIEMYAQTFQNMRPHYIFLAAPVHESIVDISRRLRKLYIIPYDPQNNHLELVTHIRQLANAARKTFHDVSLIDLICPLNTVFAV